MDNKTKNPAIRFIGFTNDWEVDVFNNLTTINQGLQIAITDRFPKYIEGSHFYITNEFLKKGSKSIYYILNPPESVICTENDILMTRTGNTGEVVTNVNGAFHNNFFKIKYNLQQIDKNFLVYFLKLDETQLLIRKLAGNSTIPDLNHNEFYGIQISFPSITEQKKIGSFFQNLDNLITLHQKKYDKLIVLKKAMLVKMFPKNGAVVPEIRFKGFNEDWEEKRLGATKSFFTDGNYGESYPSVNDLTDSGKGVPFLRGSNLSNGVLSKNKANYITNEKHLQLTSGHLVEDDIVVAVRGSLGALGYVNKVNVGWNINSQLAIVRTNKTELNGNYLIQYLLSDFGQRVILSKSTGTALKQLPIGKLKEIDIPLTNIEEQEKIGQYFQNLDNQIALHHMQLDKLKNIKKACFNKMFVAQD
jgi:type I restriction enzyme S subunit